MSQPLLYSIIVPHFNSGGLVERLLCSIPRRNDIEIIVVDDQSTEPSIHRAAKSTNFSHVQFVFSSKKVFAGGARNIGLELANGTFVLFADSDDIFEDNAFDIFDRYSCCRKLDLIQFKSDSFLEGTDQLGDRHLYLEKQYRLSGKSRLLSISPPYAKLIRRSFVEHNNIRFGPAKSAEDVCFSAKVALLAQTTHFCAFNVYKVSQREGTLSTDRSEEAITIKIEELTKKIQLIKALSPCYFEVFYLTRKNILYTILPILESSQKHNPKLVSACRAYLKHLPRTSYIVYLVFKRLGIL